MDYLSEYPEGRAIIGIPIGQLVAGRLMLRVSIPEAASSPFAVLLLPFFTFLLSCNFFFVCR